MNSLANGINETSKILSSGIMIGGSIAASGIEGVGKVAKSVLPKELVDNPIGAGIGMAAKVGKQAIESTLNTAQQMVNQVAGGVNNAAKSAGVDTTGTQEYHTKNVSDQTARVASEMYRGASDISQAAMMAGAQLIKTATSEAESVVNPQNPTSTFSSQETSFETETEIPKPKRGRRKKDNFVSL